MAQCQSLNRKELGLNLELLCQTLDKFVHATSRSVSCINGYMAIDNGGYLCKNTIRVLIAMSMDASQRSYSVQQNTFTRM